MLVYILAIGAAIAVVIIAAVLFRRLGRDVEDRDPSGVTAGHAGSMLSALFLLAFAIAIVVPWTSAVAARQNTYTESQAIVDAYWSSTGLPDGSGSTVVEMSTLIWPLTTAGLPRFFVATGVAVTASVERLNCTVHDVTFVA